MVAGARIGKVDEADEDDLTSEKDDLKIVACAVLKVRAHKISGGNSLRDPPVPIPNTEVKPQHADGTWLETARESRSSPVSNSMIVVIKFLLSYALVAQWQSIRLLTEGL